MWFILLEALKAVFPLVLSICSLPWQDQVTGELWRWFVSQMSEMPATAHMCLERPNGNERLLHSLPKEGSLWLVSDCRWRGCYLRASPCSESFPSLKSLSTNSSSIQHRHTCPSGQVLLESFFKVWCSFQFETISLAGDKTCSMHSL